MKRLIALLKLGLQRLRKYVSPVFLVLLAVSFTLWYISKLDYTYTTDFKVDVNIDGQRITVPCVVEGKGSTLFGYGFYSSSRVSIPLKDIKHSIVEHPIAVEGFADSVRMEQKIRINPVAMQDALSVRFSDLKILSVGTLPELDMPKK
ncbi:MAG: hypothetical protein IIX40_08095 [Alistipes sp.]|nr:hypothetical protein [Alistipes sp.]